MGGGHPPPGPLVRAPTASEATRRSPPARGPRETRRPREDRRPAGRGRPSHGRAWGRQLRARVLGERDAWPCAGAQAQMDLVRGRRGAQGAWGGRGKPLSVREAKGAPLARDAREALHRRQGQPLRGRGTPREPRRDERARGRRVAPGRCRVGRAPQGGKDAFDPRQALRPQRTPGHGAPREPPRACGDGPRQGCWKPRGGLAPAGHKCSPRRPVEGIVLLTRSRLRWAMRGDRARIAPRACTMALI
jgi:hypothetical protein